MPSPALKRLVNISWLTLEQLVRLLVALFVMTLVARHLGPERFGSYAYLFVLAGLFAPLTASGLDPILMRRSAVAPEESGETLGTAFLIRFCGGILGGALAVIAVVAFGGPEGATWELMAVTALTLVFLSGDTFNAWLKAREAMAWIALPRIAVALAIAGATVWLVFSEAGLGAFVALRSGEAGLLALAAIGTYAMTTGRMRRLRLNRGLVKALLRENWPLLLSGLAIVVYMRIDQVMLGWMAPERELGLYAVAVRVAEVTAFLPVALQSAFYASLVRAHARAPEGFDDHMQRLYDVMALASIAAMATIAVAAALLFVPVFGADYAGGLPMTYVLLLSLPPVFLQRAHLAMLTIRGWLWTAPVMTGLGAATNILLNLVLIPRYGGMGAAWSTFISLWFAIYGTCWLLPWLRPAGRRLGRALDPVSAMMRIMHIYRNEQPRSSDFS